MILSLLVLFFVLLGSSPWVSADKAAPENDASAEAENLGFAGRLKAELKKQGLAVKDGCFKLWGIEECPDSFARIEICDFNNPTAPYSLLVVP